MTQIATLFRALADPNRLRIVNILSHNDLCVCDIQSVLGFSQPFASRHLAYLRRMGIVQARRQGARMIYSLCLGGAMKQAVQTLLRLAGQESVTLQSDLRMLSNRPLKARLKNESLSTEPDKLVSRAA